MFAYICDLVMFAIQDSRLVSFFFILHSISKETGYLRMCMHNGNVAVVDCNYKLRLLHSNYNQAVYQNYHMEII